MALSSYFRRSVVRQFSASGQCWCENRLDVYRAKPVWCEKTGVKKHVIQTKDKLKDERFIDIRDQMVFTFTELGRWFAYKGVFANYLKNRMLQDILLSQQFIQERVDILGPDLAAAHFIITRGGLVRFWGEKEWLGGVGKVVKLPSTYAPGYYIEGINAAGMKLYHEGLKNLYQLNKLKWLSLRGLVNLNDFSLDLISGRYGQQLEYLDLTGCTRISHYGLACLYRFKALKVLNVKDMNHTPEFKLACLMIQDVLPDLEIVGIDYSTTDSGEGENTPETVVDGDKCEKPVNMLQ